MGGDLNLKKNWHPSNRPNLEKVWRAEQAQQRQLQKLEEWKKEIKAEQETEELRKLRERFGKEAKRLERLEWMYSGAGTINSTNMISEDYLLGKSKEEGGNVIILKEEDINREKDHSEARWERDLESKMREDPLFQIKRHESLNFQREERKRNLLERISSNKAITTNNQNHYYSSHHKNSRHEHESNKAFSFDQRTEKKSLDSYHHHQGRDQHYNIKSFDRQQHRNNHDDDRPFDRQQHRNNHDDDRPFDRQYQDESNYHINHSAQKSSRIYKKR